MLEPGKVGVAGGRRAVLPAHVVQKFVLPPVRKVEGRVRQNEVRLELRVAVVEEGIGVILAQVGFNAADGQIHLRHLPGGGVGVLTEHGNPVDIAAVVLNEPGRLHEHAAAAAAGVVDPAVIGLQNLHQRAHHAGGGVEFPGELALLLGKFGQAVFIGAAQDVLAVAVLHHLNVGEQVHHFTQTALVQLRPGKILGQNVLEALVFLLDAAHGLVDDRADFRGMRRGRDHLPAGVLRHKEDVLGGVFVLVLLEAVAFFHQCIVLGFETVGNVFEEDQTQHHGLVFRGVHIATQHAGRIPDLFFKADVGIGVCCHK